MEHLKLLKYLKHLTSLNIPKETATKILNWNSKLVGISRKQKIKAFGCYQLGIANWARDNWMSGQFSAKANRCHENWSLKKPVH